MSTSAAQQPSPQLFFQTINAHQRTEALKAAIELEVFTAIGEGNATAADIAKRCQTSEKGMRVLCDFLTTMEMLTKQEDRYALTLDSSVFLDKRSPAYLGGATEFLCSPMLTKGFTHMTEAVRKGGTAIENEGTLGPEHPIWVNFARGMAAMMSIPAQLMAKLVDPNADRKLKILDIAAGHGRHRAIIDATVRRARPVVLTALAAILGMIPLARSIFWGPMAITIMGGLFVATVLTLVVVPALYAMWFRVRIGESLDTSVGRPRLTDQFGRGGPMPIPIAAE